MSLTFTLQILGQRELLRAPGVYRQARIYPLPRDVEEECVRLNHPGLVAKVAASNHPATLFPARDAE